MNRDTIGDISLCLEDTDLLNFLLVSHTFNNSQTDYVWEQRFECIENIVTTSADGNFKQRYARERELEMTQKWLKKFGRKHTKHELVDLEWLALWNNKIVDIIHFNSLINL